MTPEFSTNAVHGQETPDQETVDHTLFPIERYTTP